MGKVSIIIPIFNSEKYLEETINSIINQTYTKWEAIFVDDCSTDRSEKIVLDYSKRDCRIKYYKLNKNSGAAVARNFALEKATGRFIAYLDSDDLWMTEKLERQIKFMEKNKCAFSCTDYEIIDDDGISKNKIIKMPKVITYNDYLKNTIIQTVTVMVDLKKVKKDLLFMPLIRRRQDAATWLQILKSNIDCYGMNECLGKYRRTNNSLSSNKIKAVKGTWYMYRNIEKLTFLKSCTSFLGYAFNAVRKRIYI